MASTAHQKADLGAILLRMVMGRYNECDEEGKRAITVGAVTRLTGRMTLRELKGWHHNLVAAEIVKEQNRRVADEAWDRPDQGTGHA